MVCGLVFGYLFPWWKKFAGDWEWLKLFIKMEWCKSDWAETEYSWCSETVLSRYLTVGGSIRNGKLVGWLRQTAFCKIALFFFFFENTEVLNRFKNFKKLFKENIFLLAPINPVPLPPPVPAIAIHFLYTCPQISDANTSKCEYIFLISSDFQCWHSVFIIWFLIFLNHMFWTSFYFRTLRLFFFSPFLKQLYRSFNSEYTNMSLAGHLLLLQIMLQWVTLHPCKYVCHRLNSWNFSVPGYAFAISRDNVKLPPWVMV